MPGRTDTRTGTSAGLLLAIAAPALPLLAIVFEFLGFHGYARLAPESIALIAAAAAAGTALGLASLINRDLMQPVLIALAITLFIAREDLFIPVHGLLQAVSPVLFDAAGALMLYYGVLFVLVSQLCWLLRAHLANICSIAFAAMIASSLVIPPNAEAVAGRYEGDRGERSNLAPVIHIILDGQIGLAALPPGFSDSPVARQQMLDTYRGFAVFERAFSEAQSTRPSLQALLNGLAGPPVAGLFGDGRAPRRQATNAWFRQLQSEGYAIRVYQSAWFDLCSDQAPVATCYTYPLHAINAVQRSGLGVAQRITMLATRIVQDKLPALLEPIQLSPLPAMEALEQFRSDIAGDSRGTAFIVHLLIPHEGYLYRSDCSLLPVNQWQDLYKATAAAPHHRAEADRIRTANYQAYLQQMLCIDRRMAALFELFRDLRIFDSATIVVHGDHGARVTGLDLDRFSVDELTDRDLLDLYATHFALKAPGVRPGLRRDPVSIQQVFSQRLLGADAAAPLPPANDVYFVSGRRPPRPRAMVWPD